MTIGECVKAYRDEKGLSQRQFAELCGLSNAYISILERNINPKTGRPPAPTIIVWIRVANAMGITVQDLKNRANDSAVSIGANNVVKTQGMPTVRNAGDALYKQIEPVLDETENKLLLLFKLMGNDDKERLIDYAQYIVDKQNSKRDRDCIRN